MFGDEIAPIGSGLIDDEFRQRLEMRITIIRYEIGGFDNPQVRMTHADQGFSTLEGQFVRVNFRLIPELEPAGANCFRRVNWRAGRFNRQKCGYAVAQIVARERSSERWQDGQPKPFCKFSDRTYRRRVLRANQQNRTVKLLCCERLDHFGDLGLASG